MARTIRILALATFATLLAFGIAQQGVPPAHAILDDTDGDGALDIAEEAAGSDPNDFRSLPETVGAEFVSGFPLCSDEFDNDLDGLVDAEDPGCTDSDGDLVADPVEPFYGSDPNDASSFPEDSRLDAILDYVGLPVVFCADTVDNDGDGLTDAEDPGCDPVANDGDEFDDFLEKRWGSDPGDPASVPEHETPNPGSCSDGIDNDLDGLTDGADPSCGIPDNDDRADAIVIGPLPFTDGPRLMKNATVETGEPESSCSFGDLSGTVWYSYTAAADGVLIADTVGSSFPSSVAVWASNGALEEVDCARAFGFPSGSRAVFRVEAGTTYLFQIDTFPFGIGLAELVFNLEEGVPPANDDFANATSITSLPLAESVDLTAALTEHGEPDSRCAGQPESTVWYTYTPAEDMLLLASVEGGGAVVSAWTDSIFGLKEVACTSSSGFPGAGRLPFEVQAGTTYYIQVSRSPYFDPATFQVEFQLGIAVPPANDDLADASPITALPFDEVVDLTTATLEVGEPDPPCLTYQDIQSSVWFTYTASSDTIVRADMSGGFPYSSAIGVYQGTSFDDLTSVACAMPTFPSARTAFETVAGEAYLIQVGQTSSGFFVAGAEGDQAGFPFPFDEELRFSLTDLGFPDCPSDQFSVADPIDDQFGFAFAPQDEVLHDVVSVSGGSDDDLTCITIEFSEPIDPPGVDGERFARVVLDVDADSDASTGFGSSIDFPCPGVSGLGVETQVSVDQDTGLLVPVFVYFEVAPVPLGFPPPGFEQPYALAIYDDHSVTLAIENDLVGGDDAFGFAFYVRNQSYRTTDCMPNGGHILSPQPLGAGDVNCDGRTDSRDATMIMQFFARITRSLPCQYLGDVNSNGGVGPLDAVIILQYDAGLLDELPPVPNNPVHAVVRATSQMLDVLMGRVSLFEKEARDWPDSCLGLPEDGEACLQVITPGFLIVVDVDDMRLTWRTNADGSEVRLESIAIE